nr:MAG TPA: Hint [Caudoviricetes sp.]
MLLFDLQLFGKKGTKITTTPAQVPQMSDEEKGLLGEQLKWAQTTQPVAQNLLNMANQALSSQQVTPNPNWQTLYDRAQNQTAANNQLVQGLIPQVNANTDANAAANNRFSGLLGNAIQSMTQGNKELASEYNTAMQNNSTAMQGLLNGVLPSSYAENRQKALQADLTNTVGNTLSGLASRGIINSSQADSAFNDISRNASNTLATQYGNDMQTAAGLAGQAYNSQLAGINGKAGLLGDMFRNQLSGYGQQADLANTNFNNRQQGISTLSQLANQSQQMATDPIKTAATAQEAAINTPMKYLAMATGQNAPTQGLLSQLSQQRYSVATPGQTIVRQGSGGFFGGLMSGLGSYLACFTAGTEISTPEGAVAIEQMAFGDQVISLGAVNEVQELHDMGEADVYELNTPSFAVETTQTEVFMTPDGNKPLSELSEGESVMTVNGFESITAIIATGKKEKVYELELTGDNMFYANGILAEGLTEADKAGNDPDGDIIPAEAVDVVPAEQKTEDSAEEPMQETEASAEESNEAEEKKKPAAKKPATRRKTVVKKAGK